MIARVEAAAPFPANVRAFTTVRHGAGGSAAPFDSFNLGNFRGEGGDDPAAVARNRAELVERFGLPSVPHWLRQVHGTAVVRFGTSGGPPPQPSPASGGGSGQRSPACEGGSEQHVPAREGGAEQHTSAYGEGNEQHIPASEGSSEQHTPANGRGGEQCRPGSRALLPPPLAGEGRGGGEPEADASVTSTPGVVLAILTADCLPVVFAAKDGRELAAAHAGWPGLSKGMLEATLAAMRTSPGDVVAWIGPCAGPERYEVGRNVFDAFVSQDAGAEAAFAPTRPEHWLADLPALARRRLVAAGMAAADIHGGDLCTISDPARFFSHRRDGRSGRIATIAWIDRP